MEEKYVDLHIHTEYSDGDLKVEDIFKLAKKNNLSAIAITDHDTIRALKEAEKISYEYNIELVHGIEISAMYNKREIHLIGLFIEWDNENFLKTLNYFQKKRMDRAKKIIEKLKNIKINIKFEELYDVTTNINNVGRLHIAKVLIKKGYSHSIKDAFSKYLKEDAPGYVEKARLEVEEAINIIKNVKGLAILAHPKLSNVEENIIKSWKEKGLDGIEVFHPDHDFDSINKYLKIAEKYNLLVSGGSDFHGEGKKYISMGEVKLNYKYFEKLKYANNILNVRG